MTRNPSEQHVLLGDRRELLALVRALAVEGVDAEDLVQESQLRAHLHPPHDTARARAWLRSIARNVASRWRVRRAARIARERAVARREAQPGVDETLARVELQRAVAEALLRLDESSRRVVVLRHFDDLPPRVIAARLSVPVETVRTRLKRGLARLRADLDARYGSRDAWGGAALAMGATTLSTGTKAGLAAGLVIALTAAWQWRAHESEDSGPPAVEPSNPPLLEASSDPSAVRDPTPAVVESDRTRVPEELSERRSVAVEVVGEVVDEATNRPIEGATLRLAWYDRSARADSRSERHETTVRTGRDGRFTARAEPVDSTVFEASVEAVGHVHKNVSRTWETAGEPARVDFGRIALAVGTRIAGRVVRFPEGTAVRNADLELLPNVLVRPGRFGPEGARSVGKSDADGRFELEERLVPSLRPVAILARGAGRVGFALVCISGDADLEEVEVPLEAPARLRVRVLDPDGVAVPEAEVVAYPTFLPFGSGNGLGDWSDVPTIRSPLWQDVFTATCDSSGWARFDTLLEGRDDPGFDGMGSCGHTQSYRIFVASEGWPTSVEPILLTRGSDQEMVVRLGEPCVHRVVGRVAEVGGRSLAGATVAIAGFEPVTTDAQGRYATADRDGRIGNVEGTVHAPGFGVAERSVSRSTVRSAIRRTLAAPTEDPGSEAASPPCEEYELDFELDSAGRVSGRVVDGDGVPQSGIEVRANRREPGDGPWTIEANAPTDENGGFVIDGIPESGADLFAEAIDGMVAAFPVAVERGDRDVILVLQQLPEATARAFVTVRDATTGEPLTPSSASAWPRTASVNTRPLARVSPGLVEADQLFPGDWELRMRFADGRHHLLRFTVASFGDELHLSASVGALAVVEGQLERGGSPVTGERLFVWVSPDSRNSEDGGHQIDSDGRPTGGVTEGCARPDAEGRFTIGRLPAGVPIRFHVDGNSSASTTVILEPGERRALHLELGASATVEWRLGEALPPGRIVLQLASGDEPDSWDAEWSVKPVGTVLGRSTRPVGLVRWRATWTASVGFPPARRVAIGECSLGDGRTTTVELVRFE